MSQGDNSLQPTLLGKRWTKINLGCVIASRQPFWGTDTREAGLDLAPSCKEGSLLKTAACKEHQKALQKQPDKFLSEQWHRTLLLQHKKGASGRGRILTPEIHGKSGQGWRSGHSHLLHRFILFLARSTEPLCHWFIEKYWSVKPVLVLKKLTT